MWKKKNSITPGQKEQFVSFMQEVAKEVSEKILAEFNISQDGMRRLIATRKGFQECLIVRIREFFIANRIGNEEYHLSVDYGQSLADMIAVGHYDVVNFDITSKNFPTQGGGGVKEVDALLVHFKRVIGTDTVRVDLDEMGYRPATLPELLALGKQYPELQRRFSIIAAGSCPWRSTGRVVPYLGENSDDGGRYLALQWYEMGWHPSCRFLAVRK